MDKHSHDAVFASLCSTSAAPLPIGDRGFKQMYEEFAAAQVGSDETRPTLAERIAALVAMFHALGAAPHFSRDATGH